MRAFRVGLICSAGLMVAVLLGAYLIAAESQPAAAKAPDLQARVTALEAKVAELEKRLATQPLPAYPLLAPETPVLPGAKVAPAPPAALQLPPGVPPNAMPREFNGQTYYIVPLSKEPTP